MPYDDDFAECGRIESHIEDVFRFRKVPSGQCSDLGGQVVVSEDGNPNSYIAVGASASSSSSNNNNNDDDDDDEGDSSPANMFAGRK